MNTEPVVNEHGIAAVLEAAIAADLGLEQDERIDRQTTFADLGLDSASVVALSGAAARQLGIEVPAEWLFDHPTIEGLAQFLARVVASPEGRRA